MNFVYFVDSILDLASTWMETKDIEEFVEIGMLTYNACSALFPLQICIVYQIVTSKITGK